MNDIIYISVEQALDTHLKTVHHSGGGTTEAIDINRLGSVLFHIQKWLV